MGHLLIDEYPLMVIPTLATKIGLNQAIFLQQVHYWVGQKRNIKDGRSWVYNSFEDWHKQFPFWSVRTIKRIVSELESSGLIISTTAYNKHNLNQKKWYTIDYEKFNTVVSQENDSDVPSTPAKSKETFDNNSSNLENVSNDTNDTEKNTSENSPTTDIETNFSKVTNCPSPLCQSDTLESDRLSLPIEPICHSPSCQFVTSDSDKIAIPTYIAETTSENTTEITTDISTKTSSSETHPLSPKNEKTDADKSAKLNSDIVFKRLYDLFAKIHHTPSESEKRRLYLIFEAQGEKATEYAILCSEGKNLPIGYIISVVKDPKIKAAFTEGVVNNDFFEGSDNDFNAGHNKIAKFSGRSGKVAGKKPLYTDRLPQTAAESKFNSTVPW